MGERNGWRVESARWGFGGVVDAVILLVWYCYTIVSKAFSTCAIFNLRMRLKTLIGLATVPG